MCALALCTCTVYVVHIDNVAQQPISVPYQTVLDICRAVYEVLFDDLKPL